MKIRPPAIPLITNDPYFSIWSNTDKLTDGDTVHWTGSPQPLTGVLRVDGTPYRFMGTGDAEALEQVSVSVTACSTEYVFKNEKIRLRVKFTTPLLLEDPELVSRPVTYLLVKTESADGAAHDISIEITEDDSVCLNKKYEYPVEYREEDIPGAVCAGAGSRVQHVLNKCGDDVRINWGRAYLAAKGENASAEPVISRNEYDTLSQSVRLTVNGPEALFVFAYDDLNSILYFGKKLTSVWNKDGKSIKTLIAEALEEYDVLSARCAAFDGDLREKCGDNEEYYELLCLAYRQAIAAHKLAVDPDGELLFISKECFSNGCAATVDVTYPSIPLFLLYAPEYIRGMLRPIFRYAASGDWFYPFAPHDAGTYPFVNGQVYSHGTCPQHQMPVEECGNMLITTAAEAIASGDISFAKENMAPLSVWTDYLLAHGLDPDNQLCTDDFAGHLAHNCNLSIKAIMGVAAFGIINRLAGNEKAFAEYTAKAKEMAEKWTERAANGDGTFRLAFDRPGTYSMKYNAVWDKLFGTGIFPDGTFDKEIAAHIEKHTNKYGLVLDNRADYTKSDWLLWTAAMTDDEEKFRALVHTLWLAYNDSPSRVPLTDWYMTSTAEQKGFQNRTVQGGLFIRLLKDSGKMKLRTEKI